MFAHDAIANHSAAPLLRQRGEALPSRDPGTRARRIATTVKALQASLATRSERAMRNVLRSHSRQRAKGYRPVSGSRAPAIDRLIVQTLLRRAKTC
jgi:hypothetical protein